MFVSQRFYYKSISWRDWILYGKQGYDILYIWHLERERELCENIQLMDTSRERSWAIRLTLTFLRRIIRNIKPVTIFQQGRMNKTCGDCNAFVQIFLSIFLFFLKSPLTIHPSIQPSICRKSANRRDFLSPPPLIFSLYIFIPTTLAEHSNGVQPGLTFKGG